MRSTRLVRSDSHGTACRIVFPMRRGLYQKLWSARMKKGMTHTSDEAYETLAFLRLDLRAVVVSSLLLAAMRIKWENEVKCSA